MPKAKPKVHAHTFTGIRVAEPNRVYVLAISDRLTAEGMDHTLVFRRRDDSWSHIPFSVAINDVCVTDPTGPALTLFSMSVGGEVTVDTLAGTTVEMVDESDEGPSELLQLRSIRLIGSRVYVAGLGRHVYRRVRPGQWEAIDQGVFVPRAQRTSPVGFEAIDGLKETAIYAVGYVGEIWFYDGRRWIQQDSPTNVALTCVRCLADDKVYVGGLGGTILRGSNGSWETIEQDETEEDFWGLTLFRGRVYLANYDGVFLLQDDTLERVEMGLGSKFTTAYLDADDQVMWSVGQKHLAMTSDGTTWKEIPKPN
jgi:hypothetical protein